MSATPGPDLDRGPAADEHGPGFWVALVVGGALMAWGLRLFLTGTPDLDRRIGFATWLVGLDLLHDALVAPLACLVGFGVARLVPTRWRRMVRAGLFASTFVVAVAWLPLHGTASVSHNPTIQPLDYSTATLTVLAMVWAAVGAWVAVDLVRSRRHEA